MVAAAANHTFAEQQLGSHSHWLWSSALLAAVSLVGSASAVKAEAALKYEHMMSDFMESSSILTPHLNI